MEEERLDKVSSRVVFLFYFYQGVWPLYPVVLGKQDGVSSTKSNEVHKNLLDSIFMIRAVDGLEKGSRREVFLCQVFMQWKKLVFLLYNESHQNT